MTPAILVAVPALAAAIVVLVGHRALRWVQVLAVGSLVISWALAVVLAVQHFGTTATPDRSSLDPISTGGIPIVPALSVDQLTAAMLLLATTVALLVQVYSVAYLANDPRYPSYAALVCLFSAAMGLVVAADDLFVLLVGWEVMGACSYFLIAHYWEREPARAGAVKAFVMTRFGDVGLLFGFFVAGHAAGTYRISGILDAVGSGSIDRTQATIASLLVLCGVVGKSAQFPLHSWLPDAMPGPTPISALIHAATMVAAGVYLVARLLPLFQRSGSAQNVLAVIATVTMIGSACFALAADDLKRVLAWSTVSQLALMFGALAIGGMGAGVLHLLTHGAFKALLFLAAGSVISAVGGQALAELGGLRRALPLTFATMTIGLLALAGVPPFAGFFSKDAILGRAAHEAAMGSARAWLVLVGVCITSLLTAAYATRLWLVVFFGRPVQPAEGMPPISEPSRLMTVPLVALAVAAAGGGAFVVAPGFLGVTAEPFHLVALGLGLGVVAIGIALSYAGWRRTEGDDPAVLLGPLRPAFARELSYDVLLDATVGRLVRLGSCAAAAAETDVVEPYVRGGVGAAGLLGRGIRRIHAGNITRYLTSVAVGAVGVALVIGVVQR